MNTTYPLSAIVGGIVGLAFGYLTYRVEGNKYVLFWNWLSNQSLPAQWEAPYWIAGGALIGVAINYIRKN